MSNIREDQLQHFESFEEMVRQGEQVIQHIYARNLINVKQYLGELFERYEDEGILTHSTINQYGRMANMNTAIRGLVVSLYKECTHIITDSLQATYAYGFNGTGEIVRRAWGSNCLIGIIRQEETNRALTSDISGLSWTERMNINRETAVNRIRATIVRGLHEGESYAQMAERLNDALGRDVPNAIRLMRTECYRVFSEARRDRLDRLNGIPMIKIWYTSKDERVRKTHIPMHGKKVPYKDNFILPSGNQGFAPQQIGVAAEDINCRCFWVVDLANEDND